MIIQWLASAVIVTIGVVVGVLTMLLLEPRIKSRVLAGFVFLALAAGVGWASSWIVGRVLG